MSLLDYIQNPISITKLAELTNRTKQNIVYHLINKPVKFVKQNGEVYVVRTDIPYKSFNQKKKETYHGISYKRKEDKPPIRKRRNNSQKRGLQVVDKKQHGWLTKPLDLQDIYIISSLNDTQLKILRLLAEGKTQAQVAKILGITRQAVSKYISNFKKWGFVRENGSYHGVNKKRDILYEVRKQLLIYLNYDNKRNNKQPNMSCQPDNKGDVTSPHKPLFSLHKLQIGFHVINKRQPYVTTTSTFVKSYSPRGWTGYIYLINNIRIRALPKKVIAEFTTDFEPLPTETPEQTFVRAIEEIKDTVKLWFREQLENGADFELTTPYIINMPEFAFRSNLAKQAIQSLKEIDILNKMNGFSKYSNKYINDKVVKDPMYQKTLNEYDEHEPQSEPKLWIDNSPKDVGHIETDDLETATIVDQALKNALQLPTFIKQVEATLTASTAIIQRVEALEHRMDRLERIVLEYTEQIKKMLQAISEVTKGIVTLNKKIDMLIELFDKTIMINKKVDNMVGVLAFLLQKIEIMEGVSKEVEKFKTELDKFKKELKIE